MTRDEAWKEALKLAAYLPVTDEVTLGRIADAFMAIAAQAAKDEREACARTCEAFAETAATYLEKYPDDGHHMAQSAGNTIAATIRRRGDK